MQKEVIDPKIIKEKVTHAAVDTVQKTIYGADGAKTLRGEELRTIEEKLYIVHPVTKNSSLMGLSLQYDISVGVIKQVNGLATDQVFSKFEILIPVKHG